MKKNLLILVLWLAFAFISLIGKAQTPTFDCYLTNDTFISPTVYQFDLYLLRTGTDTFEYAAGQWGITIGSACINGGTLTASIVSGTSQLNSASQVPTSVSLPSTLTFNIAGKAPPGSGSGSIISNVNGGCPSPGTRIGTFTITNTVPFSCTCMNLAFNFTGAAGKTATKVWAYLKNMSNTDITDTSTFYSYNTPGNCLKYCGTGIRETFSSRSLTIYPNPAPSKISIGVSAFHKGETVIISISNALGAVIRTEKRSWDKDFSVDVRSLPDGIYFVKVGNGDDEWVGRFVKQ